MTGTTSPEHADRAHAGQAARARHRILQLWGHNRGPLSGAFSIIDAYLALFGDAIPDLDAQFGGWDFLPKATSANAVYAALEQTRHLRLDPAAVPPLPRTGTPAVTYGPEKLGISLWNAAGRALHYQRLGIRRPVIVGVSDGELQCNIDAAARLVGAARLADLLVLLDANGLQSAHRVAAVDPTLTPGPLKGRGMRALTATVRSPTDTPPKIIPMWVLGLCGLDPSPAQCAHLFHCPTCRAGSANPNDAARIGSGQVRLLIGGAPGPPPASPAGPPPAARDPDEPG